MPDVFHLAWRYPLEPGEKAQRNPDGLNVIAWLAKDPNNFGQTVFSAQVAQHALRRRYSQGG